MKNKSFTFKTAKKKVESFTAVTAKLCQSKYVLRRENHGKTSKNNC